MKQVLVNCVGAAFACSVFVLALQAPAAAKTASKIADKVQKAEVVPDEGVYNLYQNHSWLWGKGGAGFFAVKKREFDAWTYDKGKQGYGEGIWFIPGGGKLCYRAKWHGSWGVSSSMSCFEHRQVGRVIYQRKSPNGEWYVFKKLKKGDYVSAKQRRIKARM